MAGEKSIAIGAVLFLTADTGAIAFGAVWLPKAIILANWYMPKPEEGFPASRVRFFVGGPRGRVGKVAVFQRS